MTLIATWVERNTLCFGSDSRLNLGGAGVFDSCAKVVSLPVRLLGAGYEGSEPELMHELQLGMALAGNFTTAYSVREISSSFFRVFSCCRSFGRFGLTTLLT